MKMQLSGGCGYKRSSSFVRVAIVSFLLLNLWSGISHAADPFRVFVSILPQKYLVERIVGDLASVEVMVEPGKSPETYEPSPKQLVKLADSTLYFSIGVPFENVWMPRIEELNSGLRIVDTAAQVKAGQDELFIADPHIWTSPVVVQSIATQMLEVLIEADQENAEIYQKNHDHLQQDLKNLDMEIKNIFQPWSEESGRGQFFVMHPAWSYFARTYGLEQIALENEGKEPSAKELAALIQWAKKQEIQVVFIQEQHSMHMAENVAEEIGAQVVKLDPLAEDYIGNLRQVATSIAESLQK